MAITAADIQNKITEGVTAYEGGDFETALRKLQSAQMLMAGIPRMALGTAAAKNEIQYSPEQLDAMVDRIRRDVRVSRGSSSFVQLPVERISTRGDA